MRSLIDYNEEVSRHGRVQVWEIHRERVENYQVLTGVCRKVRKMGHQDIVEPYDLGGEVEFWLEDEQHILTKTSMIFVPGGMKHCPLIVRRVDRPIFHFSTVTEGRYTMHGYEEPDLVGDGGAGRTKSI